MRLIAPGVWQLTGFPRDMFNVYLVQDVLVDAGTRWALSRIIGQLGRRRLSLVALTHCHPDHQGAAAALCARSQAPLACHAGDVAAMEGRSTMMPDSFLMRLGKRFWAGPPYPVSHVLHEGDKVAGFRVVHAPGHTPGHCMYFREADRVALAGDVLANIHFLSRRPGLREPPPFFSCDRLQNRQSVQILARLRPRLVCFGHGPPLADLQVLESFAAQLANRTATQPDGQHWRGVTANAPS
jgi:glyoxylase-like metal-dependent hydrolase (beta-lactamase superfamily II)